MKEIPLTQGKVALVDDEDYEYLLSFGKWYAIKGKHTYYAQRRQTIGKKKRITIHMHRVVCKTPDGMETDHIDENGLNNQKGNLRPSTRTQNSMNHGKTIRNTSGYKGVQKAGGKWKATIVWERKCLWLGKFENPKDAAIAYDAKAKELFGDFAKLNFPEEYL